MSWVSKKFTYVFWLFLLLCRDQSCTDILDIYNKVKAEDLSSTDEEEEVRPFSMIVRADIFKLSIWKKLQNLM